MPAHADVCTCMYIAHQKGDGVMRGFRAMMVAFERLQTCFLALY